MDQDLKNRLLSKRSLNAAEWDIDEKTLRIVRKGEPASMPTAPELQTGPQMPIQRTNEQLIAEDRERRTFQLGNGQSVVVGQDPSIRLQKLADPVGDVESAALSFGSSVLPTLAGLVAGSGATALAAPQTLGGSLAVGIPAGMATSAGAQALQDTMLLNFAPELADKINKAKAANPTTAMLGAAAVPLLTGRPTNPAAVLRALGAQNAVKNPALMRLALGSGVGAGINLGQQVAQKASFDKPNLGLGDIDVSEVIEQAALNSLTAGRSYNNRFNRATKIFGAADEHEAKQINAEKNLTTQGGDKLYTPPKPAPSSVEETIKASPQYLKAQERLKQINKKLDEAALPAQIEEAAKKPFGELEQMRVQDELGIERNPARATDFDKGVEEVNNQILNEPSVPQEKAVAQKQAIIKENEDNILNVRLEASKLKLKAAQVERQRIADSVNEIEPAKLVDVGPKPAKPISAIPAKELPIVAPEESAADFEARRIEERLSAKDRQVVRDEDGLRMDKKANRSRYASESEVPLEQRAKETGTDTAITKQQLDFWKHVAQKQGAILQVENGTILGADGKPKLGEATSRVAGQEALVRLSSAAGADTVPHELTHVFIDDMVKHGSKSDKSRAQRIVTEIEKTPEYAAWKAKRVEKGFDADGNEFLSDSTGREAFRRLMLDKDNSSFSGAWKDFVAGAKVKWLKNATAADYARFAANSIINGNPTPAGAFKVRGFGSDAGTTVPSKEESVNEQVKLALDKTSTRAAVLLTPGEVFNGNATGLVKAKTKFGDVLFNPSKTTADAVEAASKGDNFDARLLGMSQSMKPLSDTVVTTSKNGVKDVQSEQVSPEGVPAAIEAAKKAVPGGEVEVKKVKDVLEHRNASESLNTEPFYPLANKDGMSVSDKPAPTSGGKGSYDYVKPLSRVHAWTQPLLNKLASTGKPESYVAQRLEEFTADRVALHGKLVTPVQRAVSSLSDESANRVRNFMRLEADGKTPSFSLNAAEKAVQDQIRTTLVDIAEMQKKQGMLVLEKGKAREREIDPRYFPAVIDPSVSHIKNQKSGSDEAKKFDSDFIKFFVENSKGKPEVARAKAIKELETMYTKGTSARTPEFAALTTPAGFGLPDSWQSKDLMHIMTTYAERSANALAYDRHIVSDPIARKLLRIQEDNKGEKTKFGEITNLPDGTDISGVFLDQNDSVKAAMRHVTRDYNENDAMHNVVSRAVKASMMQLPAGARDFISTPAIAAQLLRPSEIPILVKALGSIPKGYEEGLRNGTIRLNTIGAQDAMFNDNAAFKYLDQYATGVNKYLGREYAERFSRAYMNTIGGMLYDSRVAAGDKASLKAFIPKDGVERTPQEERSYAIARMVESVQGAYDIRGLPAAALEGPLQTVLSLTKWSIERQNNFTKHVIQPARNGNYVPLLTSIFGGVLSGVAIQKLNQWISKSKPPEVTPEEYMNLNDDHVYFWTSMAAYSSILGLQANLAKSGMDFAKTGRTKFGIGDPVLGLGGDVAGTVKDAIEAYQVNGEMNFGIELTKSLASTLSENARAVLKYTDDQTKRADDRDRKLFERLTSDDTKPSTVIDVNPFANIDEKRFDREQDMDKAREMALELRVKALNKAKTMKDLDRSMTKLRTMPKQSMPDPFDDKKEFTEYIQFLSKIYSEAEVMEKVEEALRQKELNKAKRKLIPK